jgi:hypothetical protein
MKMNSRSLAGDDMKKMLSWLIVFFLIANMTGCEPLAKKFRRKKKETVRMPRVFKVKKYEKKPSPELYKKHYAYWSSWQSELIKVLGQNHKKDLVCIEHIVSNLIDMQNILVPEKGAELTPHIEKLSRVQDVITREELTTANRDYVLRSLEREDRFIKKNFSYTRVKNCLKKSFDDEPSEVVSRGIQVEKAAGDAPGK